MAKKTNKITLPKTSEGFDKAIQKLMDKGINTRDDAYRCAYLSCKSIELEIEKLAPYSDQPVVAELLKKYKELQVKWQARLAHTEEHLLDPIN